MKLIHYTTSRLGVVILLTMAFWSVFFYMTILDEVRDETDDSLKNYKSLIIKQVVKDSTRLKSHVDILTRYYIRQISERKGKHYEERLYTTEVFNEYEMDEEPVRVLKTAFRTDNGRYYELTVMTSTLEEDDMLESILWSIVYLYLATVICILLVTRFVFRKSLRPFYRLLNWLDVFTLGKRNEPLVNKTRVTEFRRLYQTIEEMCRRNEAVFHQQKQFIENASHELQTPLAICRNKLELLSENPDCTEEQLQDISEIHHALGRIIRLNKSLLLLSRIENRQYTEEKEMVFNSVVQKLAEDFKDIYEFRNIRIEIQEEGRFVHRMNEVLGTALVTNLLKNAVVHSPENSFIEVKITEQRIVFINEGGPGLDREKIFQRFYHASNGKTDSTGLGLAIVESITALYGLRVNYFYNGRHHFEIEGEPIGH